MIEITTADLSSPNLPEGPFGLFLQKGRAVSQGNIKPLKRKLEDVVAVLYTRYFFHQVFLIWEWEHWRTEGCNLYRGAMFTF